MGAEQLNSFTQSAYEYGFRRDAHQLIAWGYQDAMPAIHCKLLEEEITGLIVEAIRERLDDPFIPERFGRYDIHEEQPISVEGRKGKKRCRLDVVVVSGHSNPRPTYIFEAKRLRKNGYPIGRYLGEDGLKCFIQGIYASQYPEAAMIGYVQSDIASYWESELQRRFNKDLDNDFCIVQALEKATVLSSMPDVWLSKHERKEGDVIAVHHIFLDCSAFSD